MTAAGSHRPHPPACPRVRAAARAGYLSVVVAALAWLAWDQRQGVAQLAEGARGVPLAVALAVGGVQLGLGAGFWFLALRALAEARPFPVVLDATVRSLPARYVPGSVWYAVGRSALLRQRGVSTRVLAVVSVLEVGLSVVVGLVVGSVLLLVGGGLPAGVGGFAGAGVAAAAVACSPPVVNRLLAAVGRRWGGGAARLGWPAFIGLVGWLALFWISSAAMFGAYLQAFPEVAGRLPSAPTVAGAFVVARVLGMLAVFAPQGLGVFELALAAMLGTSAAAGAQPGIAELVVVVAGLRVVILVRDGLAVAIAEIRRSRPPPPF